ncbi:S41 family peptidase [Flagellimonas meridianipacifica]|uniref:Peptidase S41-like protein n=1 Tax=Flagellimonas meridianipacifica TaxID=1080225 RepID=A0A2T0M931_9FLAO|nr:S41 family peptidase [Allomuricauda pacifica]PRX53989.1 peptidase S41-like protein [Allomuricauda pacifica]
MRIQKLAILLLICPLYSIGQLKITKEEAKEDVVWLQKALEYVHPRIYKYNTKKSFDSIFGKAHKKIEASNNSILAIDVLSEVSKINAHINCGHLYTIPQFELEQEILAKKVMPFHVKILQDEIFIINDCSDAAGKLNGAKLLTVNGKSSAAILQEMKEGIATDGYIDTRKNRLIEHYFSTTYYGFDLYYYLHVDRSQTFQIEYEEYGSKEIKKVTLSGISSSDRANILLKKYHLDERTWFKTPSPRFEISDSNRFALLTVSRSFYNAKIDPDFDELLDDAFRQLKERKIQNLILDLRNNGGGSEHQQMELISYLYDKPFKLYDNIYLSHLDYRPLKSIIIERDSVDLVFNNDDEYMRKFSNDLWVSNYRYGKNLQLQPPKKNVFKGNLYVLINGTTFSSAGDLASDIRKTTDAVFIGEESGGTFEGPTGGANIVVQLPNSKIMVRISPNIQMGYMYSKHPIGRGVIPEHKIVYSIDDVLRNEDLELKKVLQLIENN